MYYLFLDLKFIKKVLKEKLDMKQITKINEIKKDKYNLELSKSLYKEATNTLNLAYKENNMEIYSRAISLYYDSISNYSNFVEPYIALSYIAWKMNEHEKAILLIKSAISIDPHNIKSKKLLEDIAYDFKNKQMSKVISKHSNKVLENISGSSKVHTSKTNQFSNLSNISNTVSGLKNNSQQYTSSNKKGQGSLLSRLSEAKKNIKVVASNSFLDKLSKI